MRASDLVLDPSPPSVGLARRWLTEVLAAEGSEWDDGDCVLALSELVTNVVIHARTPMRLRAQVRDGCLRVEVQDRCERLPAPVSRPGRSGAVPDAPQGLDLVTRLAARWGAYPVATVAGAGKVVWFEMAPARAGTAPTEAPGARQAALQGAG